MLRLEGVSARWPGSSVDALVDVDLELRSGERVAVVGPSGAAIEAAACATDLLPWLRTLPQGLRTRVGPAGSQVSGGQRQRLAVARALAAVDANPDHPKFLLVADEPSAHLDAASADIVTRSLLVVDRRRATVLITHRRQDLALVDRVLTVDDGRVREHPGARPPTARPVRSEQLTDSGPRTPARR